MKRLYFDIEVSPNIMWGWKPDKYTHMSHSNILIDGRIICICWKWAGQKTVHSLTWDKKHNEEEMLERFVEEMDKADEVVTQNGDHFDIPWVRTRCLVNGVDMMPDYVSIDTYKEAKHRFNFNSNSLAYMGKVLGVGGKLDTGGSTLWKKILMGETEEENSNFWNRLILGNNQTALDKMVNYCKQDVLLLEAVWDKMNSYVKPKSHFGWATNTCPECGSTKIIVNNRRRRASGALQVTYQCKDCGKYHSVPESKLDNPKQF